MKFTNEYILYIYVRTERDFKMATANLKKIDDKLKDMYSEQVTTTTNNTQPFVDRSELLFEQMNFIAIYNKQALHLI